MRSFRFAMLVPAVVWALSPCVPAEEPASVQKVVIPFDFESKFDDGTYGQTIGDMLWKKLQRQGGFVIPETMQDVRDWCQRNAMLPGADTPMARMKEIIVKEQAGDIGIWGKIERVPGNDTDVYDVWINVVDFSTDPAKTIYARKVRTQTVSEIPHIYVKEALDKLYGRVESAAGPVDPRIAERWEKGNNLVRGGDFEKGNAAPATWDPLSGLVTWVAEQGNAKNHVIHFNVIPEAAETTGVLYYSGFFPVEEGAKYRFQCRWKSTGSACKVFIKCYDELQGEYVTKSGASAALEKREVYRSQQNLKGGSGVWNVQTEDFTPEHTHYTPRWGRVMLYAYFPAGQVDYDDVVVKQIVPAPARQGEKDKRPSAESKVRSKEIEDADAPPRSRFDPGPARKSRPR